MALEPGSKLGPYEVLSPLGAGGMGEVYRARDTKLDREVAIKVLPARVATDDAMLARFEREAKAVAALSHPNILAIHDFGIEDGRVYAVTELLDGETLGERLKDGPLGTRKTVELGRQIARGLGAAHSRGIVHRDLKPENVIVTRDGRAKILDFGLALRKDEASSTDGIETETPTRTCLTDPGTVLGTAGYMSPEQVRGVPVDARSDIFSFGAVLYEMITGQRAFSRETSAETMTAILREEPPEPAASGLHVSPALWSLIRRCLEKQPDERFSSASDIAFALEATLQTSSSESGMAPAIDAGTGSRQVGWLPVVAALALAGVAFVAGRAFAPGGEAADGPRLGQTRLRQLTFDRGIEGQPTISPDGKNVAYVVPTGDGRDIHVQRVGGETSINVTPGEADGLHPAFSPDGERIAYAAPRGGVFVMGATGESARRVADSGFNPAWSPDGRWLLVGDEPIANPFGRGTVSGLHKIDVASGEQTRIDIEGQTDAVQPAWSPDGRWIAFWGLPQGSGKRVLFTMPAAGGRAVALNDDTAMNWNPVWSPDGRWLYFSSDRGGKMNLWRLPIDPDDGSAAGPPRPVSISTQPVFQFDVATDGRIAFAARTTFNAIERVPFDPQRWTTTGTAETLLDGTRNMTGGAVSPDGSWVAFHGADDTEDLFLFATDGSGLRRLTNDPFKDRSPRWTADSERLLFFSTRSGRYEAWSVGVDGGDLRQLTETAAGRLYSPTPSPDGTRAVVQIVGGSALIELESDLPTAERETLPLHDSAFWFFGYDWSPDGGRIAGSLAGIDPPRGIFVYSLADRSYSRVTDRGGVPVFWLPDGETLMYHRDGELRLVLGQRDEAVHALEGGTLLGYSAGFVYTVAQETTSDIWLLE